MKKLMVLIVLTLLVTPVSVLADGMPFPRYTEKTFDFTSVKEKQQYATIEVLSNYFEKMNLFLSLTSLDYENHNITIVIPLRTIPQDVTGDKIKSIEFLNKYSFDDVEKIIERQSLGGVVKKTSPQIRDILGEYIMLSLISPLYEISKLAFYPFYGGWFGATTALPMMQTGKESNYPGVTPIASYQFEDATVDIYNVDSGDTLEDFVGDYYDLSLPENVKETVDVYKNHYVAILNALIGPPSDVSLFKQYAPNTFKEALRYVRSNPEFTFTCYGGYYGGYEVTQSIYKPYGSCSEAEAIRSKFSDIIQKAVTEAATSQIATTKNSIYISNPGFESGNIFWQNYGEYYPRPSNSGYSIDYTNRMSGSNSLYVFDNSAGEWVGVCQQFSVVPGRTYKADAWVKPQQGNLQFWITTSYPSGSGSGECVTGSGTVITSTFWNKYTVSCRPQYSRTMYVCLGTGTYYNTGSGWFDDVSVYYEDKTANIESAVIDFFLNAYSNSTKGMELSMTLPIKNGEISYPLGTGVAWSTPIEDTKIMVEMDKSLDVSFANVQSSVVDNQKRYYIWSYKNWNPDFDIKGTVAPSGFFTIIGDTGKMILEGMYQNSIIVSVFLALIILAVAGVVVRYRGKGDKKKRTFFMILTILLAPFVSIWVVGILAYALKTKTEKEELKENVMNTLIFLGILILAWVFMAIVSIIIGG